MRIWPTPKPAVLTAIGILADAFGEYAFVSAKLPANSLPERFVRVSRVGGGQDDVATDTAKILVECYARDFGQMEAMAGTVVAAFRNAAGTIVGDAFVRAWGNDNVVIGYPNPDLIEYERSQVTGDLYLKSN